MKAISLDNLKRFYDKCKGVFVGKDTTINGKPLSQDVTLTGDNIRVSEDDARPMSNAVPLLNNAYKLLLAHTAPVVVHFYDAFSTAVAGANINTETNMYEIWRYKHTTGNGGTSVPPRLIKVWEEELSTDVIYCDEYDNSLMRYDATNNEWVILNDGSGIEIVQTTGQATDKVMSQKASTDAIKAVGDDAAQALNIINGQHGAVGIAPVVQETGDSTTAVMSQDAVTKALASAGGKEWEFVTQFTAEAGSVVGLVEDATIYSELHITLERDTAGPASISTYIRFDNKAKGAIFPVNALLIHWHLWFFNGQTFGIYASSSVNSKVLGSVTRYLYCPEIDGAMSFGAGATVFDGTELITIYGKKK